jgi:hypothetical protein
MRSSAGRCMKPVAGELGVAQTSSAANETSREEDVMALVDSSG